MLDGLKGYRTYIIAILGVVLNGMQVMGYIDASTIATINKVLVFIGLGTLRSAIK